MTNDLLPRNYNRLLHNSARAISASMADMISNIDMTPHIRGMNLISSRIADMISSMDMTVYNRNTVALLRNATEMLSSIDTTVLNQSLSIFLARTADAISSMNMATINKSMAVISSGLLKNFSSFFESHDFSWLNSMSGIISHIDENNGFDYDAFETEEDLSDFIEAKNIVKTSDVSSLIKLSDKQKLILFQIILAVLPSLAFFLISKPSVVVNEITYHINYYHPMINNYYVAGRGFDNTILNDMNLRFINRVEVFARAKPDNSSTVIGKPPFGKVVEVVDKYKKWRKIRWSDEGGSVLYGWVQNWKLNEFR